MEELKEFLIALIAAVVVLLSVLIIVAEGHQERLTENERFQHELVLRDCK